FPRLLEELPLRPAKYYLFCSPKKEALGKDMASLKTEKPAGSQLAGQAKQDPPKQSSSAPKAPATKPAPKKAEAKPAQPRKKCCQASGGKK
ncbi:uncharacterized protein J3R85_010976, partial [Psidium guajava]